MKTRNYEIKSRKNNDKKSFNSEIEISWASRRWNRKTYTVVHKFHNLSQITTRLLDPLLNNMSKSPKLTSVILHCMVNTWLSRNYACTRSEQNLL